MLWVQAGVSFLAWCFLGVWVARDRRWFRPVRPLVGALLLTAAGVFMVGSLIAVASLNGIVRGSLVPWAWITVTVCGLVFVFLQGWGAHALAANVLGRETDVTRRSSLASKESDSR